MTAIYKRELRAGFTGMANYVFIAFLLVFAGLYTMLYNLNGGYPNFEYVLQSMSIIFLIAIPILTMRAIAGEWRQHTDQLLYSLPIGMTRVVLGKYLAILTVVAVPCLIMAVYPLLLSAFGTVTFATAYGALIGFFLLSAALSAIPVRSGIPGGGPLGDRAAGQRDDRESGGRGGALLCRDDAALLHERSVLLRRRHRAGLPRGADDRGVDRRRTGKTFHQEHRRRGTGRSGRLRRADRRLDLRLRQLCRFV